MKNIIILSIICFGTVISTLFLFPSVFPSVSFNVGTFNSLVPNSQKNTVVDTPTSLSLVGDVMLARRVDTYLQEHGSDYVYSNLPELASSTILVGNFESSIPEVYTQTPDLTFTFSTDSAYIPAFAHYGFAYVGLANNHSYDSGAQGFRHTQDILATNNIRSFGSPLSVGTTSTAYIYLENKRVALVGIYAVDQQPTQEQLKILLHEVSAHSDFQIAYIHWGLEYAITHSKMQEKLAHMLINEGVDAIIGHHPHVVQDIEIYKNVPIFYSLGNFIFDQYFSNDVQEGLWITVSFKDDTVQYVLHPITSIGSQSVPRFMSAHEKKLFLEKIEKRSSPKIQEMIHNGVIVNKKYRTHS